jgi:hypothetical protein
MGTTISFLTKTNPGVQRTGTVIFDVRRADIAPAKHNLEVCGFRKRHGRFNGDSAIQLLAELRVKKESPSLSQLGLFV